MKFDTKRDIKRLLGVLAGATFLREDFFREELQDLRFSCKEWHYAILI